MSLCNVFSNFFRCRMSLGRAATKPRSLPQYSEEVQRDWARVKADLEKLGDTVTVEQLNSIFNSGKEIE